MSTCNLSDKDITKQKFFMSAGLNVKNGKEKELFEALLDLSQKECLEELKEYSFNDFLTNEKENIKNILEKYIGYYSYDFNQLSEFYISNNLEKIKKLFKIYLNEEENVLYTKAQLRKAYLLKISYITSSSTDKNIKNICNFLDTIQALCLNGLLTSYGYLKNNVETTKLTFILNKEDNTLFSKELRVECYKIVIEKAIKALIENNWTSISHKYFLKLYEEDKYAVFTEIEKLAGYSEEEAFEVVTNL